ncbi:uncharacterized protein LOC142363712 [Opisthocomus hoazin]|uniref:uncharacterized protein LOC142363712 n=1 Tax=Opisthocomus hoazin TaxID=30419 RepID=UPI003F534D7A
MVGEGSVDEVCWAGRGGGGVACPAWDSVGSPAPPCASPAPPCASPAVPAPRARRKLLPQRPLVADAQPGGSPAGPGPWQGRGGPGATEPQTGPRNGLQSHAVSGPDGCVALREASTGRTEPCLNKSKSKALVDKQANSTADALSSPRLPSSVRLWVGLVFMVSFTHLVKSKGRKTPNQTASKDSTGEAGGLKHQHGAQGSKHRLRSRLQIRILKTRRCLYPPTEAYAYRAGC